MSRGADIERRDVNLMSPLMLAACEGHAGVVKVLLIAGFYDVFFIHGVFCACMYIVIAKQSMFLHSYFSMISIENICCVRDVELQLDVVVVSSIVIGPPIRLKL